MTRALLAALLLAIPLVTSWILVAASPIPVRSRPLKAVRARHAGDVAPSAADKGTGKRSRR